MRPEVELGDYANFNFAPEIEEVDDGEGRQGRRRAARPERDPRGRRGPRRRRNGDWAVIGFAGTRDGVPFDGGTSERMPLILGEDRLIPGFEANLVGLRPGESTDFDITFPEDYPEETLAGQQVHFAVDLKELREKVLPEADDAFAQNMGDYEDLAPSSATSTTASIATPSTGRATSSPTRSSSTPSPTPRSTCPTSWWTRRSR